MTDDFAAVRLTDTAHVEMGQSPDSKSVQEGCDAGAAFLQGNAEFGTVHPSPRFCCAAPMKMCRAGDVLISVRAPVGALNIADRDYCIGRGLAAIRVNGMPPSLAAQVVLAATPALRRVAQGTTFEAISKTDLMSLVVAMPPTKEWGQLAWVIDTLDTAIRQTDAIIEKLKHITQGLLHDLLTRGLDANGGLRPPRNEAPYLYKQSPLGWIPTEWRTSALGALATSSTLGPFGSDLVSSDYRESGVPVIFVRDVKSDRFEWKSEVFITPSKASALHAHGVRPGDVVATKMGFPPCISAVYPEGMPDGVVTADIVRLRFDPSMHRPRWISLSMNGTSVRKQVEQITAGVTRPKVTLGDVRGLLVCVPSVEEQDRILERVGGLQRLLDAENIALRKLQIQKLGVMDDLLSGSVRVTPLLDAAAA